MIQQSPRLDDPNELTPRTQASCTHVQVAQFTAAHGQQSTERQPKHPLASEQQNVADTNNGAQPGDRDAGQGDGCEGKGSAVSLKTHFIE